MATDGVYLLTGSQLWYGSDPAHEMKGMTADLIHFRVHGEPKPFRKRMRVAGTKPYAYSTHAAWQGHIAEVAAEHAPEELWEGAVGLTLIFFRPKPKSVAKDPARCRNPLSRAKATWPITRPDLTSLARVVEDALTGVVYGDDSQVVQNLLLKQYGPRFVLEVMAYQMESPDAEQEHP